MSQRSLRLVVRTGEGEGQVLVQRGDVFDARLGERRGVEAVYAMLGEPAASYTIHRTTPETFRERTVEVSTQHLLLEAARLEDEWAARRPPREVASLSERPEPPPPPRRSRALPIAFALLLAGALLSAFVLSKRAVSSSPEQAAQGAGPARNGYVPPELVSARQPVAFEDRLGVTPTIDVEAFVDTRGRVADARLAHHRPELGDYEKAALEAAQAFEFRPARRDGQAVSAWVTVPVRFRDVPTRHVVRVRGSDTAGANLLPALSRAFRQERTDTHVDVRTFGSSSAFASLFDGTADVGVASRTMDEAELAEAARLGVRVQEFVIGYDGVAILVHPENPVTSATLSQLSEVFSGHVGHFKELSPEAARSIHRYGRPVYSGTRRWLEDRFRSVAAGPFSFAESSRLFEGTRDLMDAVARDANAIGYAGLGRLVPSVRALAIAENDQKPFVAPTAKTIADGSYPLSRPLLLYTVGDPGGAVADFLNFVRSPKGRRIIEREGFVPARPAASDPALASQGEPAPAASPYRVFRVPFRRSSTFVDARGRAAVDEILAALVTDKHRLRIVGNADSDGNKHSSVDLALVRAHSVADALREAGVAPGRMEIASAGLTRPVASNETPTGRDENRRVDVYVLPF